MPGLGNYSASAFDDDEDDRYWFGVSDFLEPARIELGDLKTGKREPLKSEPTFFKADGLQAAAVFHRVASDGTRIPYFQVARKDLALDGNHPVLLTGYGGFEVPVLPRYDASVGAAWLEAGGRLRGGQHPGRRGIRAGLAPGGHQAQPPAGLRRLHRGGRGPHPAQGDPAPQAWGSRAAPTAAC